MNALPCAYNLSVHYAVFNNGHSEHTTPLGYHVLYYDAQINEDKT
jgi:hypothetical protein